MISKYKVIKSSDRDLVSLEDAKKILGVASVKDLRRLGECTVTVDDKPLWDLSWVIGKTKYKLLDAFHPDFEWIREYESEKSRTKKKKKKKAIKPVRAIAGKDLSSSKRLKELVKRMPPPAKVPNKIVEWKAIEKAVGVKFPKSYKDFIAVYGTLEWFGKMRPLAPFGNQTPDEFRTLLDKVFDDAFDGDTENLKGEVVATPHFGTEGGLLPFMTGTMEGEVYSWLTIGSQESWCVVVAIERQVTVLPPISIVEMIMTWLLNEGVMDKVWGTIDEFRAHSPDRVKKLA